MIKNIRYIFFLGAVAILLSLTSCFSLVTIPTIADTENSETLSPEETESPVPKKRVALTFDDGPAYDNETSQRLTYKIVDKLAEYGGKATFFLVGNRINSTTGKAITYAYEHGSEIGIHAYTHDYDFSKCSDGVLLEEIKATKEAIETYSDAEVTVFRPPYGSLSKEKALLTGYPVIMWNVDSKDWEHKSISGGTAPKNIAAIVDNVISSVEDGDIILMHEIYRNSCEAAIILIDRLSAEGYEFVTVSELLGDMTAGSIYYSAQ